MFSIVPFLFLVLAIFTFCLLYLLILVPDFFFFFGQIKALFWEEKPLFHPLGYSLHHAIGLPTTNKLITMLLSF